MGLRSQIRRHSKDLRLIVAGLGALLVLFSGFFYLLLYNRDLEARMINNRVLLFALWYANVVLILTVLFVLMRILFKTLVERKHRILGSKFKTKLIATYIGLSLFPVLLLFFFANQLLNGSIERWFSVPLKGEVLEKAADVAGALSRHVETQNLRHATVALSKIGPLGSADLAEDQQVGLKLKELLDETGLDFLAVYSETAFLRAVISPRTELEDLPDLEWHMLREAVREGKALRVEALPGRSGLLTLAAVSYGAAEPGTPPLVVVAGTFIDRSVAEQMQELRQLYQTHRQLVVEKDSIKASHFLLFLMATLLILLASSWVGLYLARRVTVPVQALADGTRQIMSGDLAYRVDVDAGDELGVLVDSFNLMTGQLEQSRNLLEQSNRELVESNRRQAEERALIAAVLQNVAAGVISLDAEGRVFTCNGAARSMLGLPSDVLGLAVAQAFSGPEREKLLALLERLGPGVDEAEGEQASEIVDLVIGGAWRTFELTVTPLADREGAAQGRVIVLEELTDLVKAQKLAAWTEAARRIAHEIKNPLTPIKLSAERLLKKHRAGDPETGKALEDAVATIVREVDTMQDMVDEFSRYARMPFPQPIEVDFARLVAETVELYARIKPGVAVVARVAPEAKTMWIDGKQIKQALINLLDNAVEATTAPGRIEVEAVADGGTLRLTVADTGRGIPDADKEKLFLPYFSTKGRGTGLGLAIVHRIVSDHRGRIRVENNTPTGTVFTLELPLA